MQFSRTDYCETSNSDSFGNKVTKVQHGKTLSQFKQQIQFQRQKPVPRPTFTFKAKVVLKSKVTQTKEQQLVGNC